MEHYKYGNRILAMAFIALLVVMWCRSASYTELGKILGFLHIGILGNQVRTVQEEELPEMTLADVESEYMNSLRDKSALIDLNGALAKWMNVQGYYSDMGMYVTDDGAIVSMSEQTLTAYEYYQIMDFKSFLDERGIQLLYVNCPTKYTDDTLFRDEFGIESYSNINADLFLRQIRDSGVNTIDLREEMKEDGLNIADMFYRTDHHWTTRTGLWAAKNIAEGLNEYCGYAIDLSIYDEENYSYREWKDCWLGEQGMKLSLSYVGLDDYTEIKPNFPTNFIFKYGDGGVEGTFDDFINEGFYNTDIDVYSAASWHYSYSFRNVVNCNVDNGKILFLGDSYAHVVEPFLALGVNEIDILSLRDYEGSVREYIDAGDYDTVIISYAQFMIGAHDDPDSANYEIFSFG